MYRRHWSSDNPVIYLRIQTSCWQKNTLIFSNCLKCYLEFGELKNYSFNMILFVSSIHRKVFNTCYMFIKYFFKQTCFCFINSFLLRRHYWIKVIKSESSSSITVWVHIQLLHSTAVWLQANGLNPLCFQFLNFCKMRITIRFSS